MGKKELEAGGTGEALPYAIDPALNPVLAGCTCRRSFAQVPFVPSQLPYPLPGCHGPFFFLLSSSTLPPFSLPLTAVPQQLT